MSIYVSNIYKKLIIEIMVSRKCNPQPNSKVSENGDSILVLSRRADVLKMFTIPFRATPRKTCAARMAGRASIAQRDFHFRR
jgi:hypothetical protein